MQTPQLVIECAGMLGGDIGGFEAAGDEFAFGEFAELRSCFGGGEGAGGDGWGAGLMSLCKKGGVKYGMGRPTFFSIHSIRAS